MAAVAHRVEVAGNAASLQEAIDKAAASLRGLADYGREDLDRFDRVR